MNQTKLKGRTASVVEFIVGGFCLLVALTSSGVKLMGMSAVVWLFLGLMFISMGLEWRFLARDYRIYSTILSHNPNGSISAIAQATKTSEKTVKDNLRLMIKKGLAVDTALDEQGNRVLTKSAAPAAPNPQTVVEPTPEKVSVTCSGCGATSELMRGTATECEHCGTPISA